MLGLKLLLQRIEITLAFIGANNCALDIDDPNLCRHSHVAGRGRVVGVCRGCGGARLGKRNSGENEGQSHGGKNLAYHLCGELLENLS